MSLHHRVVIADSRSVARVAGLAVELTWLDSWTIFTGRPGCTGRREVVLSRLNYRYRFHSDPIGWVEFPAVGVNRRDSDESSPASSLSIQLCCAQFRVLLNKSFTKAPSLLPLHLHPNSVWWPSRYAARSLAIRVSSSVVPSFTDDSEKTRKPPRNVLAYPSGAQFLKGATRIFRVHHERWYIIKAEEFSHGVHPGECE